MRWWSCRRTGSRSTRPRGRSGRCARTRGRRGSPGTGAGSVPGALPRERRWYSGAELHKRWNQVKKADPALGWWEQNSKCAYQEAFRDLDRALRDFAKSRKGERKGRRLGFPRFKKRGRCRDSFRLTGALRCGRGTVTLPRLGVIRTHECTRKLARRLEDGSARILSATVSRTAQRWFVSLTVAGRPGRPGAPPPARHRDRDRPGHQDAAHRRRRRGHGDHHRRAETADGGAAPAAARRPRARPDEAGFGGAPQGGRAAGPPARPGREPARRRAAQGHQHARRPLRDGRGRGPERGRDDPQPPPRPRPRGSGVRDGAADARPTRPPGTAGRWSSRTAGFLHRRPARAAAR